jgi:aryl-alcohol dehydrogenase-like predicted oxidoreductase
MMMRMIGGRAVGAVGLGCMSFGGMYGGTDIDASFACLDEAARLGVTHLDVAEIYGGGRCEEIMGQYLGGKPGPFVIATKAGIYTQPTRQIRNDAGSLRRSLEGSLTRLGLDRVELFYLHRRTPAVPLPDVIATLVGFIEEGLIGGYGLSEVAPATIRDAHAIHPVTAVQSEYSLWTRLPELGVLQTCRALGIAFVPFSPVGRGILADRFPDPAAFPPEDFRRGNPRFEEPNYSRNKAAIAPFQAFCHARGWSTSAAAIAWLLDRGDHIIPVPGTRTAAHLRELRSATEITLTDDDRIEIDRLLPPGFAHGARYTEAQGAASEDYC